VAKNAKNMLGKATKIEIAVTVPYLRNDFGIDNSDPQNSKIF
jgi:hypothetical protein